MAASLSDTVGTWVGDFQAGCLDLIRYCTHGLVTHVRLVGKDTLKLKRGFAAGTRKRNAVYQGSS